MSIARLIWRQLQCGIKPMPENNGRISVPSTSKIDVGDVNNWLQKRLHLEVSI